MNIQEHMGAAKLETYSFMWSEARLLIAAVALLLGGIPPLSLLPLPSGLMSLILTLAWIISGVASVYLLYRWFNGSKMVFGGADRLDLAAFGVSVVSGINLGIVGLLSTNIGMNIASNYPIFVVTAVVYLAAAAHLFRRFKAYGEKIF